MYRGRGSSQKRRFRTVPQAPFIQNYTEIGLLGNRLSFRITRLFSVRGSVGVPWSLMSLLSNGLLKKSFCCLFERSEAISQ